MARYGWVVAVNPLGQTIASPIFGILYSKTGSARLVGVITSVAYIFGNILYSTLTVFPEDYRYPLLLVSRFIVGACAGIRSKTYVIVSLLFLWYVLQATSQPSGLISLQPLLSLSEPLKCRLPPLSKVSGLQSGRGSRPHLHLYNVLISEPNHPTNTFLSTCTLLQGSF